MYCKVAQYVLVVLVLVWGRYYGKQDTEALVKVRNKEVSVIAKVTGAVNSDFGFELNICFLLQLLSSAAAYILSSFKCSPFIPRLHSFSDA